jgi:hypothetical protein
MVETPGMTREQYDASAREINAAGPPAGIIVHVAGPVEGGWRIVEVWESQEAIDAFFGSEHLRQVTQALGIPQGRISS